MQFLFSQSCIFCNILSAGMEGKEGGKDLRRRRAKPLALDDEEEEWARRAVSHHFYVGDEVTELQPCAPV